MVDSKKFRKHELIQGLKTWYRYDATAGALYWLRASPENGIALGDRAGRMKKGDFTVTYRGVDMSARRVAWLFIYGEFPEGALYCRDGDPENLRAENLVRGKDLRHEKQRAVCLHCGTSFMKQTTQQVGKYCSRPCYHAAKVKARPTHCGGCGGVLAEAERLKAHRRCVACQAEANKVRRLAAKYGISPLDFEKMAALQGNRCAICGEAPESGPVVDHDHVTGAVRGLLCHPCNSGLGMFRDRPETLRAAADYVESSLTRHCVTT